MIKTDQVTCCCCFWLKVLQFNEGKKEDAVLLGLVLINTYRLLIDRVFYKTSSLSRCAGS